MSIEMRRIENALVPCYHIDEEKTLIEPVMKKSHDHSSNLLHGVCITDVAPSRQSGDPQLILFFVLFCFCE
jgi:hypothetical protein